MSSANQILLNFSKNKQLSSKVVVAKTFFERSKGLLGQTGLTNDECLWIHHCNSIHTFFMKFSIDVLYVDKNLNVTCIHRDVKPWKLSWGGFNSSSCFEFQANKLSLDVEIGDSIRVSS